MASHPDQLPIPPALVERIRTDIEAAVSGPVDVIMIVCPIRETSDGKQGLGWPTMLTSLGDRDAAGLLRKVSNHLDLVMSALHGGTRQ